jgi:hypothetical protein
VSLSSRTLLRYHEHTVQFENGDAGSTMVGGKNVDKWKVGNEVEYEKKETQYGTKIKAVSQGQGYKKNSYNNKYSLATMCLSYAKDVYIAHLANAGKAIQGGEDIKPMSEKELLLMANKFKKAVEKMTDATDATSGSQQPAQQRSQQSGPPTADFSQERGKTQQYSPEEVAQAAKNLTLPEEDDDMPF